MIKHLEGIADFISKQENDLGTMASYAQRETSELAEACLIFAGKIEHKDTVDQAEVISELADSIQSAYVLAAVTLNIPLHELSSKLNTSISDKNDKWIEQIENKELSHFVKVANDIGFELTRCTKGAGKVFYDGYRCKYDKSSVVLGIYKDPEHELVDFFYIAARIKGGESTNVSAFPDRFQCELNTWRLA